MNNQFENRHFNYAFNIMFTICLGTLNIEN